jgi:hypothetical protein
MNKGVRTSYKVTSKCSKRKCGVISVIGSCIRVQDSARRETLYTAHRGGARAAQLAAAEFAIFRVLDPESRVSPDRLAKELKWQEYW